MTDENLDAEGKIDAQASVWARDGEGPHAFVAPEAIEAEPEPAPVSAAAEPAVEQAETLQTEAETGSVSEAPAVDVESDEDDTEEASDEADDENEPEADAPEKPARGDGSPTQNDVAIGYLIVLGVYFFGYIINQFAGGYCMMGDKMNALGDLCFFWTPALGAAVMLLGSKAFKITGAILFLPLAAAAVYAGQYFHTYEGFLNNTGPYGPIISEKDENGWHICQYESSWTTGNQPGTTWTREKDVAPGIRYRRKMRLGEPP
ncbi:MAG: hypothetical protein JST01_10135 [Cyanobacteria bacterium SZAS TMP-1]|nr:hypothetical protein [Cyanobacteria bacterium SZAS TMP-1]